MKETTLKETTLKETALKETALKETALKETTLKEIILKPITLSYIEIILGKKQLERNIPNETDLRIARVTAVHKERYCIITKEGEKTAKLKGSVYYNNEYGEQNEEYPVVGDFVIARNNPLGDDQIIKTLERSSKLSRLDSFNGTEQVLASNFDFVLITMSLNDDFNLKKLERYLAIAWESGGSPIVIFTKTDLCEDTEDKLEIAEGAAIGVPIIGVSSYTGEGYERLEEVLNPGKTFVLLGSSGVGKSSLVNALTGDERMKIGGIREDDSKGRHTTTHRQMIFLESGAMLIDTPGIREVGMWDSEEGFDLTFSDVAENIKKCQFSNCTHQNEPGCKVREALEMGNLTSERWNNYLKLQKEIQFAQKKLRMVERRYKDKKKDKPRSNKISSLGEWE